MKCPYCNNGVSRYSAPGFRWPCTICDGTGEVETNNEEWLDTLSTVEKPYGYQKSQKNLKVMFGCGKTG